MVSIETERLLLRGHTADDLDDVYEYLSDPETVKFEPHRPMTRDEAREALQRRVSTDEMVAVELKAEHKLIGNMYLGRRDCETLELGYVFNRRYWKRGYAYESCKRLIEAAFRAGIHRVYAECDPQNPNSWRLLERLGFVREAHFISNVYFWKDSDGAPLWKDTYVYSLLNKQGEQK